MKGFTLYISRLSTKLITSDFIYPETEKVQKKKKTQTKKLPLLSQHLLCCLKMLIGPILCTFKISKAFIEETEENGKATKTVTSCCVFTICSRQKSIEKVLEQYFVFPSHPFCRIEPELNRISSFKSERDRSCSCALMLCLGKIRLDNLRAGSRIRIFRFRVG